MKYIVTCLADTHDGLFEPHRVRATSRTFTRDEAERYAATIDPSREPQIESVAPFTLSAVPGEPDRFKLSIDPDVEPLSVIQGKEKTDD